MTCRPSSAARVGFALFATAACRGGAGLTADDFVQAYFVQSDLQRAHQLSTGAAKVKLAEELQLVAEVRATGYSAADARSGDDVRWRRADKGRAAEDGRAEQAPGSTDRPEAERAYFEYDVTAQTPDKELRRRVLISLRKETVGWRVSNFQVNELSAPKPSPKGR